MELMLDNEIESEDNVDLLVYLQDLQLHPFNLNTVTIQELQSIPWISAKIARDIINYRKKNGAFTSVSGLLKLKSVDDETFFIIKEFVTVDWKKALSFNLRQRVYRKKELSAGYEDNKFAGGPEKVYNRLTALARENYSLGLVLEKDAGETRINDHFRISGMVKFPQLNSTLYLGSFNFETGQGLVFWGPFRLTKGVNPVQAMEKTGRGLTSYTSSSEYSGYDGVGISSQFGPWDLNAFYSSTKLDASADDSTFTSLDRTGLHRTDSEIAKANQLTEKVVGFSLGADYKNASAQFVLQSSNYDKELLAGINLSDKYDFNGKQNSVAGLNYSYFFANLQFYGEYARSQNNGRSFINSAILKADRFDFVLSFRNFSPEFQNLHALAFGKLDLPTNEQGLYFGFIYKHSSKISISYYADLYRHPWLRYNFSQPSSGWEQLFFLLNNFNAQFSTEFRLKIKAQQEQTYVFDLFGNEIKKNLNSKKYNLRLQADYQAKRTLAFRTRMEYNFQEWDQFGLPFSDVTDTTGFLIYHQFSWDWHKLNIKTRWCYFDAPDYDVRFYVYENDLPGVMKLKMLQNRGTRFFVLSGLKLSKLFKMYAKYERTFYDNRDFYGSGNSLTKSNQENAFSVQVEWNF